MTKKYSLETNLKATELKQQGYSTIKNNLAKVGNRRELHRIHQPIGNQYTYQLSLLERFELEQLQLCFQELKIQNDILGNLKGITGH